MKKYILIINLKYFNKIKFYFLLKNFNLINQHNFY